MSVKAARAFRQKVNDDPALQREVRKGIQTQGSVDAVALGKKYGFEFSQADIHQIASEDSFELNPFELEMVSAGTTTLVQGATDSGGCERLVTPTTTLTQPTLNQPTVGF